MANKIHGSTVKRLNLDQIKSRLYS